MSVHPIEVRNLRFPLGADVPKYWLAGKKSVSTFWNNLSVLFPAGELFFMNSVKAHEPQVTDAKLKDEVRRFYQQEAMHSREHVRYNNWLKQHGYPIDEMDESVRKLLAVIAKLPNRLQLAVTCSLEHFTAMLAQFLLVDDGSFDDAHPTMQAMWRWHAAEENEHAEVAFDVFKAIGGTYPERVVVMFVATLIFWGKVIEQQLRMMKADGTLNDREEWKSLATYLFKDPAYLMRMIGPYLQYYKPGFHPSHLDASKLLERWKKDFESLPVYRDSVKSPVRAA